MQITKMVLGKVTKLSSQFRVTYNMILNLLRVEAIKVEDMMKRSFSENRNQRSLPDAQLRHEETSTMLKSLKELDCIICNNDISQFYIMSARTLLVGYQIMEQAMKNPIGIKSLCSGRVVVVNNVVII